MPINWKRGLFRAWLTFGICWVVFAGWIQVSTPPAFDPSAPYYEILPSGGTGPLIRPPGYGPTTHEAFRLIQAVLFVVGPPMALLLVGFVISWIIRGFRTENPFG